MRKGLTFLPSAALAPVLGLTLVAALSLPVAAAEPGTDPATVVARVNGEEITLGHMIVAHATLPQQYQQLQPEVLYNAILEQLIQQSALSQAVSGDDPAHVKLALENERRSLLAAEEIEKIMAATASESDVRAAYDEKYGDGFGGEEFNASHILVDTEEEAKAIVADLDGGADFAEIAKEKSTGPSGPEGGSLGWFAKGAMVPEFEAAVLELEPGQASAPVQTQFGWHVVILNDKRKQAAPELEAVREELAGQLREAAVENRVEELTRKAQIDRPEVEGIDPTILRDLDLLRN